LICRRWERVALRSKVSNISLTLFTLGLLLTGCAVGPDYHRPAALGTNTVPAAFGELTATNLGEWKPAEPSAHLPRGGGWELCGDPNLTRIKFRAGGSTQDLAAARAHFEQARALANVARAGSSPQVSPAPSFPRQRLSANQSAGAASPSRGRTFDS